MSIEGYGRDPKSMVLKEYTWKKRFGNDGLTIIELMVVVALLAIIALVAVPRLSRFFSSRSENMAFLTKFIAKTHDDSFLNNTIDFLTIHLYDADPNNKDEKNELLLRMNGVSVLAIEKTVFVENSRSVLQYHEFPGSFRIKEVVLKTGETIKKGYVMIPFYPQGYSENAILHIEINNDDKWSLLIRKHFRDPKVVEGWVQAQ